MFFPRITVPIIFLIPSRPWNVPSVQVNDVPVSDINAIRQRLLNQRSRFAERVAELRSNSQMGGLFRPRFLHPLYATVNPFDADLDDSQREQIYDSDMITTVTPNHRIQAWDVSDWSVPNIGSRKYYTIFFFVITQLWCSLLFNFSDKKLGSRRMQDS